MNCHDCQNLLHRLLDGESAHETPEVRDHLANCVSCRRDHAAAHLLLRGMKQLPKPQPTTTMTSRLFAAVQHDRQARRRRSIYRWYATAALAASLLVFVGLGYLAPLFQNKVAPTAPTPIAKTPEPKIPDQPAPAEFTRRAEDAQKAVVSLTKSAADKTKTHLDVLLSATNPLDMAQVASLPPFPDLEEPFDPAAQSLRNAGLTVAHSLEPVAQSARRAFDFFAREMPVLDFSTKD